MEDMETLYEWTSKEGWHVLRLDAKMCENVIQHRDIYRGFQTYEGFLKLLKGEGDTSSRYSCVDKDTEVMSKKGWLHHWDLSVGDYIYTVNPHSGLAEWKPVLEVFEKWFDGELVSMSGDQMSALVTPNHKWAYTNKGKRGRCNSMRLSLKETKDLKGHDIIPLNRQSTEHPESSNYTDDMAFLVGLLVTSGIVGVSRGSVRATIYQSSNSSLKKLDAIRSLLKRMNARVFEYVDKSGIVRFKLDKQLSKELLIIVGPDKLIPVEFIESLAHRGKISLLLSLILGCGVMKGYDTPYLCFKDRRLADSCQFLVSRLGESSCIHLRHITPSPLLFSNDIGAGCDMYCVDIKSPKDTCVKNMDIRLEEYSGFVWCPRTDNGTFMARRNGLTYFTGNTFARGWPPLKSQNWTVIPASWPSTQRGEAIFDEIISHCASVDCAYQGMDKVIMTVGKYGIASGWVKANGETVKFLDPSNPKVYKSRPVLQYEQQFSLLKSASPSKLAEEIKGKCLNLGIEPSNLVIDGSGQGSGTASWLKEYWGDIMAIDWGRAATEMKILTEDNGLARDRFPDIISEMWFAFKEWLNPDVCAILIHPMIQQNPINAQLTTRRFSFCKGNKQKVESKESYKARNQRSPDEVDSMIMLPHLIRSRANVMPGLSKQSDTRKPIDESRETVYAKVPKPDDSLQLFDDDSFEGKDLR
jgi:hypothetical protein